MTTDPRIAVLSALSSPSWHPTPEAHGMPWDEAEQLLAAYDASRAAVSVSAAAPPTAAPVKQRADCTEMEWAEQERARFERLYTRETVRVDLAEKRADTAARDADIYQQRLEQLGEGYTRERKRAEAMERAMESTAADALAHGGCHRDLMGQCLRAERAEAEAQRLRTDRTTVLLEAAQHLYTALFPAVYNDLGQKAAEGVNRAVSELRRLAAETAEPAAQAEAHSCSNCEGIDPDTCWTNPNRPPEQCPAAEFVDYGQQCQKPVGHELHTFEEPQPAAVPAVGQAVCKCPVGVCGCGHHAVGQTDEEA